MRTLIAAFVLLLAACSTTVGFAVRPGATLQVRDASGTSRVGPDDPRHQAMADWIARNQRGWSQLYATNPSGGISVTSGDWGLQFFGKAVYLNTAGHGMLTKDVEEADYAFLRSSAGKQSNPGTTEIPWMSTKNMAVVCRLAELPGGSLRVVLDDVREGEAPGTWTYHSLFTYKDYVPGGLDDLTALTDTELADFGYHVLARLLASNGRNG